MNKLSYYLVGIKKHIKPFVLTLLGTGGISLFFMISSLLSPLQMGVSDGLSLAGFYGPSEYLVILQNDSERRPGGGFISAFAKVHILFGIPSVQFFNSYDVPAPESIIEPPYPLNELLDHDEFYEGWVFRDANWSPMFDENVKNIFAFYEEGYGYESQNFDGVITINMSTIIDLIGLSGPIVIDGETYDKNRLFHKMQVVSKNIDLHSLEALENRKDIMKPLFSAWMKNIIFSPSLYDDLIQQVALHINNQGIQGDIPQIPLLENSKFQFPKDTDFVHVNMANIGGRKADRYIVPEYKYQVEFDENGKAFSTLHLQWFHAGEKGLYSDFYQSYVRVFLPKDIINIKYSGDNRSDFVLERSQGENSVGTLIHLWPGETQELLFRYELPSISKYNYQFTALPMMGMFEENWSVILRSKVFDSYFISDDFNTREHVAFFHENINTPTVLQAMLKNDDTPPVVLSQRFKNGSTIILDLSEPVVTPKIIEVTLKDLNKQNKINDELVIKKISQANNQLVIQFSGMTTQLGEAYGLSFVHLEDMSSNVSTVGLYTVIQK
ncbi:hypothetical protein COB57_03455 [Candidatus Peregrinibacteria bacterium]|nr:MAG: hypothetical protein COB57_03455 [Candidatus Peregrinibacteria bacterium]